MTKGLVIVTDAAYATALNAVRCLGRDGYTVVATQTKENGVGRPATFFSRYLSREIWIDGARTDAEYKNRLKEAIRAFEGAVLLPMGQETTQILTLCSEEFSRFRFLLPSEEMRTQISQGYRQRAGELRIPLAGENELSLCEVGMLTGRDGDLLEAVCHAVRRRDQKGMITCCESIYDPEKIDAMYQILSSFGYTGFAWTEWRGTELIRLTTGLWPNVGFVRQQKSRLFSLYAKNASGEAAYYTPGHYLRGVMRYGPEDRRACLSDLAHGKIKKAVVGLKEQLTTGEIIRDDEDRKPSKKRRTRNDDYFPR